MRWRIIDLSDEPVSLSVRHDQLIIKRESGQDSIPLEELAVLIAAHPRVSITQSVLNCICANGGAFIVCDERKMPSGMIMPLSAHFVQTERFAAQVRATLPSKKLLWKQIIKAKISAQGSLLSKIRGDDLGLLRMAAKVRSGDPENLEARASRRYWPVLFGDAFLRKPAAKDNINSILNYGYAVLRSLISRALCASGLHPSIGIHHHNRYNPFCLADDAMEPYRPFIDEVVLDVLDFLGRDAPVDKASKGMLLEKIITSEFIIGGESRNVFDTCLKTASSLADVFMLKKKKLVLPET